jgi:hypothetical protein
MSMSRLLLSIFLFLPGALSAQQAAPAASTQLIERALNQQLIASAQRALDVARTVPGELRTAPMAAPTRRPAVDEPFVALVRDVYIERSLTRPRPADAVRVYPSDAR